MKKNKKWFIAILLVILSFSPVSFPIFPLSSQAVSQEEITGYQEWTQDKTIEGWVTVDPEATLVIKKGVTITFKGWASIIVLGKLFVDGTRENPVKFRLEKVDSYSSYSVWMENGSEGYFRNVDVAGGGSAVSIIGENSFVTKAYADSYHGAINADRSKIVVENCNFHDNVVAIYANRMTYDSKVNLSKFSHNSYDVASDLNNSDFQYNWWNNPAGPQKIAPDIPIYETIVGEINFSNWLTSEEIPQDPVLIIPGILGSQKKDGVWVMDPVLHTYDNLYNALANNGYTAEKDLFTFPYEWRDSNVENAKLLKEKIAEIKEKTHWPKVDIVAHSMGGLMAREYIESDYYQDDVDQLITLGTPNNGAPESYLQWEGGEAGFLGPEGLITNIFVAQEAEEYGFDSILHYIHNRPLASIQELLPIYNYLQDVNNSDLYREYPNDYPLNSFLEELNKSDKLEKLNKIEFTKIIGKVENNNSTIAGFKIANKGIDGYWENGYPINFDLPLLSEQGIIRSNGDRTVPLISSESANIPCDNIITVNSGHTNIPTDAQGEVYKLLTGKDIQEEVKNGLIKNMLFVQVYSPIDIQVISPSGKKIGKDFTADKEINEIKDAYYSGFNTKNEFITIPNPEDGKYQIITQGTGNGDYKIKTTTINQSDESQEAKETTNEIIGTTTSGQKEDKKIEIKDGEVVTKIVDVTSPKIAVNMPQDSREYLNNANLAIDYQVTDNVTPADKLENKVYFDGEIITDLTLKLPFLAMGEHKVKIESVDEAGNKSEKKITFSSVTNPKSIRDNVNLYYKNKLIKRLVEKDYLLLKLTGLEISWELLNRDMKHKKPEIIDKVLSHKINMEIDTLIQYVENRNKVGFIDDQAKNLLIDSLKSLAI